MCCCAYICNEAARIDYGYFFICKIVHPPPCKAKQNINVQKGIHAGLRICMYAFLRVFAQYNRCRGPPAPYQFSQKIDKEH